MNIVNEVQGKLKQEIKAAVIKAGLATEEQVPQAVLELPKDKTHGDYSTNMAMQLTKIAKKSPKMIAEAIIENFDQSKASIEKIEIAGPGFINFYMNNSYLTELVPVILKADEAYGESDFGQGEKIQVEIGRASCRERVF